MQEHWSLGTVIGGPVLLVVIVGLSLAGLAMRRKSRSVNYDTDRDVLYWGGLAVWVVAGVFLVGTVVGFYPYKTDYHKYEPISGHITQVSSRFLGDSDSTTQRFVVVFDDGSVRSCDDTRCALLKAGDWLALSCIKNWQWAATDGFNCNYVGARSSS